MQHQFKIHDVHEHMERLSEEMDAKLTFSGWEQRLDLPDSVGSGFILRMMIRPGLEVLVEYLILRENLQLHIEQECQVLGLAYHVSGDRYCEWNGTPVTTSLPPGRRCSSPIGPRYIWRRARRAKVAALKCGFVRSSLASILKTRMNGSGLKRFCIPIKIRFATASLHLQSKQSLMIRCLASTQDH
ncbi:hypothetical protein ABEV00_07955 [Paenibacillus thiaminolyticus]|uniref:hypothetical protein n=1 Tax=Paenibacillus thiaminolyticus TaxID=49283 RepID=UPI003D272898